MNMKQKQLIWVYALFFLFFLQLLSDFIESIYVFGLLSTGVTLEIISIVLLFSPIVLLVYRKGLPKTGLILMAAGVLVSRLIALTLGPSLKMVISGIGVGCWLVLFPGWLWTLSQSIPDNQTTRDTNILSMGVGMVIALALSILLRMLGAGFDVSTYGWTQILGWLVAAFCIWIIGRLPSDWMQFTTKTSRRPAFRRIAGLSLGAISVLVCIYFALMSPNVIARWTGVPYPLIISVFIPVLGVFIGLLFYRPGWILNISRKTLMFLNVLLLVSLTLTLLAHQISFPGTISAYPLSEPPVSFVYHIPLFLLLLLSPVIVLDFMHFLRELLVLRPTLRQLGGGFTLAAGFMLILILGQVFTTVYDYIPVIGPWFRDRFWLVFMCMGAGFTIPVLLLHNEGSIPDPARVDQQPGFVPGITILLFMGFSLIFTWATVPTPNPSLPGETPKLRVLTYNIQQGYSEYGVKNFAGQLEVLRNVGADIIGLQESDTNRVAGGNSDIVGYFARALNMHTYYGPKTVTGTFGVALLSKYPIETAETFYMYSVGEQTAAIHARIQINGHNVNVVITHLGNGGPIEQQQAVLEYIQGLENVILVGDFNFRPDSEQYALTVTSLEDAWLVQNMPAGSEPALDPNRRIDHIFITPGTPVMQSRYIVSPASDHPALWADLTW